MSWRLFIDDERDIAVIDNDSWFMARSYQEAVDLVSRMGMPISIDFDHDLGDGPTGAAFADWLIGCMLNKMWKFPNSFSYYVHSQNPIGANNIRGKMDAAIKHIGYENS